MKKKIVKITALFLALFLVVACSNNNEEDQTAELDVARVTISFVYNEQEGYASNQYAVWIEDMDNNYVTTLFATNFTAEGGYKERPNSLRDWVKKSDLADKSKEEISTFAGATPKSGEVNYDWILTDENGNTVPDGEYRFFVEGTLRDKNQVLYSGVIKIGNGTVTVDVEPKFHYEATERYEALSGDSIELGMIVEVQAIYYPE